MHTKRLQAKKIFHESALVTAGSISALTVLGFIFLVIQASGASSVFRIAILDPNQVDSSPSIVVDSPSGAGSFPMSYFQTPVQNTADDPATPDPETPAAIEEPLLTIQAFNTYGEAVTGRVTNQTSLDTVPVITDGVLRFEGLSGMASAQVFIELHHTERPAVTTSITANQEQYWTWDAPEVLLPDRYTIYAYSFDPTGTVRLGSVRMQFVVTDPLSAPLERETAEDPRTFRALPESLFDAREVLFDIKVEILSEQSSATHLLHPGDMLIAQVSLLNIGSPGYLVDTSVTYQMLDTANKVLFEEEETIGVATQASFLKRFSIGPSFSSGNYRLVAKVRYEDTEAVAYDQFTVGGSPIIRLPGGRETDISTLLNAVIALLTIGVLVTYLEYRNVQLLKKVIRQVNEKDLLREGLISTK